MKKFIFLASCLIVLLFSCSPEERKRQQYFSNGKMLYIKKCKNCHQENGEGLGELIPPIQNSDYFLTNQNRTICLIFNGLEGEIQVNGKTYNQPMPANPKLSCQEIAFLMTFLYNTWGSTDSIFTKKTVEIVLDSCSKAE